MASEREELERQVLMKRVMEKRAAEAAAEGPTSGEQAEAALSGFGESATFGYLPELQAATYPAFEAAGELLTGQEIPDETYDQRLEAARAEELAKQQAAPGSALAGQLGGFLVPGMGLAKAAKTGAQAARGANLARTAAVLEGAAGTGTLAQKRFGP